MILTYVDFTGDGDGVHAIYIDGKLFKYGDYYHNKINTWYEGFKDGLIYSKIEFVENTVKVTDEEMICNVSELAETPPEDLTELL